MHRRVVPQIRMCTLPQLHLSKLKNQHRIVPLRLQQRYCGVAIVRQCDKNWLSCILLLICSIVFFWFTSAIRSHLYHHLHMKLPVDHHLHIMLLKRGYLPIPSKIRNRYSHREAKIDYQCDNSCVCFYFAPNRMRKKASVSHRSRQKP